MSQSPTLTVSITWPDGTPAHAADGDNDTAPGLAVSVDGVAASATPCSPAVPAQDDLAPDPGHDRATQRDDALAAVPDVPPFQVRSTRIGHDVWTIEIIGVLDRVTAALLDASQALSVDPTDVPHYLEIELSQLTFLDAAGLDALRTAVAGLEASGAQVTVVGAHGQVRPLLAFAAEHCWLTAAPILTAATPASPPSTPPSVPDSHPRDSETTTGSGRPVRRMKPRGPIDTTELLAAVADLGRNWPARFGHHEIIDVNTALDRELIAGTLLDAVTLSPRGRQRLLQDAR